MSIFAEAFTWLTDPEQWEGSSGIPALLGAHIAYSLLALVIATAIAAPLGWAIGHTGRGRSFAVGLTGAARAMPSLGLLTLLVLLGGVGLKAVSAVVVLVVLAVPSIMAGAYAGIDAVPRPAVDAARGVGMTGSQVLWRLEVPLGLPLLLGGVRAGALQVVSTVTIAAFVGLPNLGTYLIRGLRLGRYEEMLGGALLIAALALLIDGVLALAQRLAVPRGVHVARGTRAGAPRVAPRPTSPGPSIATSSTSPSSPGGNYPDRADLDPRGSR